MGRGETPVFGLCQSREQTPRRSSRPGRQGGRPDRAAIPKIVAWQLLLRVAVPLESPSSNIPCYRTSLTASLRPTDTIDEESN
jgi:hypothetical protein